MIEKMIRCENSEVLPAGSVAVAEMRAPASVATGSVTSIAASPLPSVVTCEVAEVGLALDELAREVRAGRVGVEVEVEGRRGRAVELADDPRAARALRPEVLDRLEDREVLQEVGSAVGVAGSLAFGPAVAEVDAETAVVVDRVAADHVVHAGVAGLESRLPR